MEIVPSPTTVTFAQLSFVSCALMVTNSIRSINGRSARLWVAGLAVLKLSSTVASQMSLLKTSVAYTHTVKATLPIFAVGLSRMIMGQRHSWLQLCSLLPVVGGVMLSSHVESELDAIGIGCALMSVFVLACQNLSTKHVMAFHGVDSGTLVLATALVALVGMVPLWMASDGLAFWRGELLPGGPSGFEARTSFMKLLFAHGAANTVQTLSAFAFLKRVAPVTYAVANVSKRMTVIIGALIYYGGGVTTAKLWGLFMSSVGLGLFNYAKVKEKKMASASQAGELPWYSEVATADNKPALFTV